MNILQQGITLEPGISYTLTFDAKATTDKQISTKAQLDHDPWTSVLQEPVMISTSFQTYSVTWDQTDASDTYKVGLFFGSDTTNVWLDNVKLTSSSPTKTNEEKIILPEYTQLMQNYPNPFNPTTSIKYQLPYDTHVSLKIYNLMGELVKTLIDSQQRTGYYTLQWDGRDKNNQSVATGLYIYSLKTNDYSQSRKMLLLK